MLYSGKILVTTWKRKSVEVLA